MQASVHLCGSGPQAALRFQITLGAQGAATFRVHLSHTRDALLRFQSLLALPPDRKAILEGCQKSAPYRATASLRRMLKHSGRRRPCNTPKVSRATLRPPAAATSSPPSHTLLAFAFPPRSTLGRLLPSLPSRR